MHLHEYQAKSLLDEYAIPIPPYAVASHEEDVRHAIDRFNLHEAVIKVQIHAGGRGKAGGVKFAKNKQEILEFSKELIGKKIVNSQTGPQGLIAHKVIISPPVNIKKEYYLSALIDRNKACAYLIASKEGGQEIEDVASNKPEAILKEVIDLNGTLRPFQLLWLTKKLGWIGETQKKGMKLLANLAKLFTEIDASLVEINPLIETPDGNLLALDAKISIDDNALFRQPKLQHFYDPSQLTHNEVLASEYDLSYVALDGNIGCMVNGAGLAMATMDILYYYNGRPANFLDAGGSATLEKITQGVKLLLNDSQVNVLFVNIFGGIMDCALIAQGIVNAIKEEKVLKPIVARLEGTNVDKGKQILANAKIPVITVQTMAEGAMIAVKAAQGGV